MVNFEKLLEENPEFKEKYERLTDEGKLQVEDAFYRVMTMWDIATRAVNVCKKVISLYPNKRVLHLAVRSKKARVRKKNMHRLRKDIQRYGERGLDNG